MRKEIFVLTKYATTKGIKKIVKSDHNVLYAKFSMQYRNLVWKRPRKEVFNLKNLECQAKFTKVTNESIYEVNPQLCRFKNVNNALILHPFGQKFVKSTSPNELS